MIPSSVRCISDIDHEIYTSWIEGYHRMADTYENMQYDSHYYKKLFSYSQEEEEEEEVSCHKNKTEIHQLDKLSKEPLCATTPSAIINDQEKHHVIDEECQNDPFMSLVDNETYVCDVYHMSIGVIIPKKTTQGEYLATATLTHIQDVSSSRNSSLCNEKPLIMKKLSYETRSKMIKLIIPSLYFIRMKLNHHISIEEEIFRLQGASLRYVHVAEDHHRSLSDYETSQLRLGSLKILSPFQTISDSQCIQTVVGISRVPWFGSLDENQQMIYTSLWTKKNNNCHPLTHSLDKKESHDKNKTTTTTTTEKIGSFSPLENSLTQNQPKQPSNPYHDKANNREKWCISMEDILYLRKMNIPSPMEILGPRISNEFSIGCSIDNFFKKSSFMADNVVVEPQQPCNLSSEDCTSRRDEDCDDISSLDSCLFSLPPGFSISRWEKLWRMHYQSPLISDITEFRGFEFYTKKFVLRVPPRFYIERYQQRNQTVLQKNTDPNSDDSCMDDRQYSNNNHYDMCASKPQCGDDSHNLDIQKYERESSVIRNQVFYLKPTVPRLDPSLPASVYFIALLEANKSDTNLTSSGPKVDHVNLSTTTTTTTTTTRDEETNPFYREWCVSTSEEKDSLELLDTLILEPLIGRGRSSFLISHNGSYLQESHLRLLRNQFTLQYIHRHLFDTYCTLDSMSTRETDKLQQYQG